LYEIRGNNVTLKRAKFDGTEAFAKRPGRAVIDLTRRLENVATSEKRAIGDIRNDEKT